MRELREAVGLRRRSPRVRTVAKAPLGTKPPAAYLCLRDDPESPSVSDDDVDEEEDDDFTITSVAFPEGTYIGVVGFPRSELWIARACENITLNANEVRVQWLERSLDSWIQDTAVCIIPLQSLIMGVDEYVFSAGDEVAVDDTVFDALKGKVEALKQERRAASSRHATSSKQAMQPVQEAIQD